MRAVFCCGALAHSAVALGVFPEPLLMPEMGQHGISRCPDTIPIESFLQGSPHDGFIGHLS